MDSENSKQPNSTAEKKPRIPQEFMRHGESVLHPKHEPLSLDRRQNFSTTTWRTKVGTGRGLCGGVKHVMLVVVVFVPLLSIPYGEDASAEKKPNKLDVWCRSRTRTRLKDCLLSVQEGENGPESPKKNLHNRARCTSAAL